jgi:Zn-dependent protease with chaperone function
MEFAARHQDGLTAEMRDVVCAVDLAADPVALVILDAATRAPVDRWPAGDCFLLHARADELRLANRQRPAGARLAVTGAENMQVVLGTLPRLARHRRSERWGEARLLGIATAALAAVIVAYLYGIPLLAGRLAAIFPPAWEMRIGATAARQIEATLTGGAGYQLCDPDPASLANRAIARFVAAAFDGLASPFSPEVAVIRSDIPNAFALPGGQTFYLSALIEASHAPDEFAGVLAHELGHVYHRHGMQTLISTSTTGLLVGFVLGDLTGLSVAGAVGAALIDNRFSRAAEAEADAFAGRTAQKLGFSPAGLVDLLERVSADDAFSRALALFSNHPLTADRRRALEAFASEVPAGRPAFSDAEWRAITAMCPPAAPAPAR